MNELKNLSERRLSAIIWSLVCLAPIFGMAIDLLAPALPAIAHDLQVSDSASKNLISLYLLGYALGNFSGGLLTDSLGRRKLLIIGLVSFILASLLPVFFPYIKILWLARFLQGVTIGQVGVVTRAALADILPAEKLVKLGVLLGTMFGIGPVIGPFIGGYLQYYFDWKACFMFFAIIMFIEFVVIYFVVPETLFKRQSFNIQTIGKNLKEIFSHKEFMAMTLMMGSVYSLVISFNTLGPFLIQTKFHYSSVFFGYIALCMGVSFLTATLVCRYLLRKYTAKRLFFVFIRAAFVFALLSILLVYNFKTNLLCLCVISAFMFFASGFIFPMSMGNGMSFFKHIAGTASATMYLINILITSLTGFVLSFLNIATSIPLIWIYLAFITFCLFVYSTLGCSSKISNA